MARLGAESFYDAPVSLPSGALLKDVKFYGIDTDAATNITFFLFEVCVPEAGGVETSTIIATGPTAGHRRPTPFTVDICHPEPHREQRHLRRHPARPVQHRPLRRPQSSRRPALRWARQVSPAPATATFPNDVPTTISSSASSRPLRRRASPAAAAPAPSARTAPVTRARMAVFISVALGLTFQ